MSYVDRELGWEDQIENDSQFSLVPEGDYNFKVLKFERGRHNGSENLPPCNKAILTIEVFNGRDKTVVTHNLFLHTKTEGLLCEFFTSIGQRKHGEVLKPRWNEVIGATGTCKVGIRKWKGNDGNDRESMDIKRFYEKGKQIEMKQPAPPVPQSSYTPGAF